MKLLDDFPSASPWSDTVALNRVLVVDDHPVTARGVAAIISQEPDMEVCGIAGNAAAALALVRESNPRLAVVDISLPGANGLDFIKQALALRPELRVLVLSMHDEQLLAPRAFRVGARGYLMKHEASSAIVPALRQILSGSAYISRPLREKITEQILTGRSLDQEDPVARLSDREMEVLALLGDGYTTRQIADRLALSIKTIDSYREHLKEKLNIEDGASLLRFAIRWQRSMNIV